MNRAVGNDVADNLSTASYAEDQAAENLHRSDLTALERDEQISRWVELIDLKRISRQPDEKIERGRPESGPAAAKRPMRRCTLNPRLGQCGPRLPIRRWEITLTTN
jgi:hypothetical protein